MNGRAVLVGSLMLIAASASAQGVVSFDGIPLDREPTVEINMGPETIVLLSGAAKVPGEPGPLDGLTNIRVLVYEDLNEDLQDVLRFIDSTATRLEGDGWHAVVRVRDGDEHVRVYMKPGTGGTLSGVTVMVTDSGGDGGAGEVVLLNVAGAIQPAQLGQIAATVGMGGWFRGVPGLQLGASPKRAQD